MFGHRIEIFNLFGFPVRLDASWLLLVLLIVWTLSAGYFPSVHPGYATSTYWLMGLLAALGLFFSIIVHEFAHALVARRHGLPMSGITLFLFGGVSEMEDEPLNPSAEFWIALAGPATSLVVGLLLFGLTRLGQTLDWPVALTGTTFYLAMLNGILILFNMLPAFPLDGGRILRAILWRIRDNLHWATRISARIGAGFAILLMLLGVVSIFSGNLVGGFWWVLIGMFLKSSATQAYEQLLVRRQLEGKPVHKFMNTHVVAIPPDISLQALIDQYFYDSYHRDYPVVEQGQLIGHIMLENVKAIPTREWSTKTVRDLMDPVLPENSIAPDEDALQAMDRLNRAAYPHLMVVENAHLLGLLSLKDLARMLSMRAAMEERAV